MLFLGIDHPALSCNDPRKLAAWYCKYLGMKILADDGKEQASMLLGYGAGLVDVCMVEIMPVKNEGPQPEDVPRFCPGFRHMAIRVSDFDKAYAILKEAGVPFLFEPGVAIGGGKVVSFRDPEGNELQIVQR